MKLRLLVLLTAAICAALALSACGGGGDDTTGSGEASVESFCSAYTALQEKTTALQESSGGSFDERKQALSDFVAALDDLSDASPAEIADEVEESAAWARGAEDAVSGASDDKEFEKAGSQYASQNPQPTEASQAADSYAQDNCSDGDDTTDTDTTG